MYMCVCVGMYVHVCVHVYVGDCARCVHFIALCSLSEYFSFVCSFSVFVVSPQGKMLTDCFETGNVHMYSF